jgi:isopenicillin-N N-acyltransferase-like protein
MSTISTDNLAVAEAATDLRIPEGAVPRLDVSGSARDCGVRLGEAWRDAVNVLAASKPAGAKPWWKDARWASAIQKHAPHLPDVYLGIARGAGVAEDLVGGSDASDHSGCTSFAVHPSVTRNGIGICGQTKDTPVHRAMQYQVLALKVDGAPAYLTVTYAGWLFGHGFVRGGCAIFRNALWAGESDTGLPLGGWGLLALHCATADGAYELAQRCGVASAFHMTIADENGGIVGIESGRAGIAKLQPTDGIYVHANAVCGSAELARDEDTSRDRSIDEFRRDSADRESALRGRLQNAAPRVTPQQVYAALQDHDHYPRGVCRHRSESSMTTATIVAEPALGRMHVTRGPACSHWPVTYQL